MDEKINYFPDEGPEHEAFIQQSAEFEDQASAHLKNINQFKKGSAVPPPPKPGEIIHCQMCRQPMLPANFSKNLIERRWEFKWQVHWACKIAAEDYLDRLTPSLVSERRRAQKVNGVK